MTVPDRLRPDSFRERRRRRAYAAHQAREAQEETGGQAVVPDFLLRRKPGQITLILAVLTVLGAMLIGRASRVAETAARAPARTQRTASDLQALRIALERFRLDTGRYPTPAEGLRALVRDPGAPGWRGHYVNLVRWDPWRQPFQYQQTTNGICLWSYGPDRKGGTSDDILALEPSAADVARPQPAADAGPGSNRSATNGLLPTVRILPALPVPP